MMRRYRSRTPYSAHGRCGATRPSAGLTAVELVIVLAIIGLLSLTTFIVGRRVLAGQERLSAMNTVRQSVWTGATLASARGVEVELRRVGQALNLQRTSDGIVLRTFVLPNGSVLNAPDGQLLRFSPPGRVAAASLAALPDPLTLTIDGSVKSLQISLIGEVREVVP